MTLVKESISNMREIKELLCEQREKIVDFKSMSGIT